MTATRRCTCDLESLLVPHLSFNVIGSLPAILPSAPSTPYAAAAILRIPAPHRAELKHLKQLPPAAVVHAHRVLPWRRRAPPQRPCLPVRHEPQGEAVDEVRPCAFLVHPTYVPPHLLVPTAPCASPLVLSTFTSPTSTFSAARCSSVSLSSDAAAVSPSRIRRHVAAAVRVHRHGEQAFAAAAVRARMMEADDGESQEYARPRIAAYPDDPSTWIALRLRPRSHSQSNSGLRCAARAEPLVPAGEAAVRVHKSLPRILVKHCACLAFSVENRELARSDGAVLLSACTGQDDTPFAIGTSRLRLDSSLGLSIAIFLDLCDTARSHADSAARTPEHARNHAREVTSKSALLPFLCTMGTTTHLSSLEFYAPVTWAEPRAAASDVVDNCACMALALSLEDLSCRRYHESTHFRRRCATAFARGTSRPAAVSATTPVCTPGGRRPARELRQEPCIPRLRALALLVWLREYPGTGKVLPCPSRARRHTTVAARFRSTHLLDAAFARRTHRARARSILTAVLLSYDVSVLQSPRATRAHLCPAPRSPSYHFRCIARVLVWEARAAVCAYLGVNDLLVPVHPSSLCAHGEGERCPTMSRLCSMTVLSSRMIFASAPLRSLGPPFLHQLTNVEELNRLLPFVCA
ncbi:hypothetical protein C8R45DRAFT_1216494 [Mycena sanguinolenta]|nr:hypothetical protein C8R45DRAFT_1216494 [Mycena sanguinolenta]